jgi:hypothetical protein
VWYTGLLIIDITWELCKLLHFAFGQEVMEALQSAFENFEDLLNDWRNK